MPPGTKTYRPATSSNNRKLFFIQSFQKFNNMERKFYTVASHQFEYRSLLNFRQCHAARPLSGTLLKTFPSIIYYPVYFIKAIIQRADKFFKEPETSGENNIAISNYREMG
jgi:hypothetical protein